MFDYVALPGPSFNIHTHHKVLFPNGSAIFDNDSLWGKFNKNEKVIPIAFWN